jgi:hypothetical protein
MWSDRVQGLFGRHLFVSIKIKSLVQNKAKIASKLILSKKTWNPILQDLDLPVLKICYPILWGRLC